MIRTTAASCQILALAFGALLPVAPASAQVVPAPTAHMTLKSYTLTLVGTVPANGDNDGYADANETLDLALTLINKSGKALTDVTVTLVTYSPTIACIGTNQVVVPSVPAGATFTTPPLQFRVADASVVDRADVDQAINATFDVRVHADEFLALDPPIGITLSLDLSATGGSGTSAFVEDFEIGGTNFGKFTKSSLDAGKNSLALSDGMRCQYNDPDGLNSNSANNVECFLGFASDTSAGINDWHVHDATASSGGVGRAYVGSKSIHWGVHNSPGTPKRDTVRLKQLDAIKSSNINLPLANVVPELVFAHQVSLVDNRGIGGIDPGEAADRAVVEINALAANGLESPVWIKLTPYVNEYDSQGTDDFTNCTFDPTDDGNNEDSFFDPGDPQRRLGPSTTCYPERVFVCSGHTDYHLTANPANICRASDGPGLPGSIDVGTWVQSRFNLQQFAGRRVKIRFLATSAELGVGQNWDSAFFNRDDVVTDDGWYIDDVRVNQALGLALTLAADTKTITPIPCAQCGSITAALTATPEVTAAPGSPVVLDAAGSAINVCSTSPPMYQFWIDGNNNGIAGDAGDTLVRDFAEEPTFAITPEDPHQYAVLVRCPSTPACDAADGSDTAVASSAVTCSPGITYQGFPQTIYVDNGGNGNATLRWEVADSVDVIMGRLSSEPPGAGTLRVAGSFTGTVCCCPFPFPDPTASVWDNVSTVHEGGEGVYYLVRGRTASTTCSAPPGYTTNAPTERPGRDPEIAADPEACP
jgi:hypothetical protein